VNLFVNIGYVLNFQNKHLNNFLVDQCSGTMSKKYRLKPKTESKMTFDMGLSLFLRHYSQWDCLNSHSYKDL